MESDNEKLVISIVTKVTLGMQKMLMSQKYQSLTKLLQREKSVDQDKIYWPRFLDQKYFLHGWCSEHFFSGGV